MIMIPESARVMITISTNANLTHDNGCLKDSMNESKKNENIRASTRKKVRQEEAGSNAGNKNKNKKETKKRKKSKTLHILTKA